MAEQARRELTIATPPTGSWVQTERAAHEQWSRLALAHPRAAAVLHLIVARLGRSNALVVSQQTLATLAGCSLRTVQTALRTLRDEKWISVVQVGASGTVNAYVVNDQVAWVGARDGMRFSLFSATIIASSSEQPDDAALDNAAPLHRIPSLAPGEQQLPVGPGLPPPSQPHLDGLEPDLPVRHDDPPPQPPARRSRRP